MTPKLNFGIGSEELISNGWVLEEPILGTPGSTLAALSDSTYTFGWHEDGRLYLYAPHGIKIKEAMYMKISLPWLHDVLSGPTSDETLRSGLKLSGLALHYLAELEIQRLAPSPMEALRSYEMALQLIRRLQTSKRSKAQKRTGNPQSHNSQPRLLSGMLESGGCSSVVKGPTQFSTSQALARAELNVIQGRI